MAETISRRDFMLQSLAATGGLLVTRSLPLSAQPGFRRQGRELKLWYRQPAAEWVEALPVGNGRLGAMVFGTVERERLQLKISHLFGVHPGREITPEETPELFRAAARSMELRGDEATGWSMGWKINFWARMRDGDHALRLLSNPLDPLP